MSRAAPRPLTTALQELAGALAPASKLARVQEVWEGAVGPAIAAAARPTAERDGVLTVTCEAAVWAQELDLMADALIPRLNAALGGEASTSCAVAPAEPDLPPPRSRALPGRLQTACFPPFCRHLSPFEGRVATAVVLSSRV